MTNAARSDFDRSYFARCYRDYARQNPPGKLRFYRRLIEDAVGERRSPRVLELGCAFGRVIGSLDRNWRLRGVDISEYAIARARQHYPWVRLGVASATAIPFDGPFDIVAAFDTFEHVSDLDTMAREIGRCMERGGTLVFVVPVYDGPVGFGVRMLDRDPTHVHKRSLAFWRRWATRHFGPPECRGILRGLLPGGRYIHLVVPRIRGFVAAAAFVVRGVECGDHAHCG